MWLFAFHYVKVESILEKILSRRIRIDFLTIDWCKDEDEVVEVAVVVVEKDEEKEGLNSQREEK